MNQEELNDYWLDVFAKTEWTRTELHRADEMAGDPDT